MQQYIKRVDIILLIKLLKLKRLVALIAIKNKQATCANNASLYISIKVLQLGNTQLVIYLAIITNYNRLVA